MGLSSRSIPFGPNSFHYNESLVWFLIHHLYQTPIKTPLEYPSVVLSRGDPVAIVPHHRPLHSAPELIDGVGVGVCQLKILELGLSVREAGQFSLGWASALAVQQQARGRATSQGVGPGGCIFNPQRWLR